jgi:hypothetical protein
LPISVASPHMTVMSAKRRCIVCGMEFVGRSDSWCCTVTCRSRLHRGGRLAYLAELPQAQQQARRACHEAAEAILATERLVRAARRERRTISRRAVLKLAASTKGPSRGGGLRF